MAKREIRKSFRLESEPVLHWPMISAERKQLLGVRLTYSGGLDYTLHPEKAGVVETVGWSPQKPVVAWRDVFSESELKPRGLIALAQLSTNPTSMEVSKWVSKNGLLGFRPNPAVKGIPFIPVLFAGNVSIHHCEPIPCILTAAKKAANVLALWSALKQSYKSGGDSDSEKVIRSIVTLNKDIRDSSKEGAGPVYYRTFVNGEDRNRWPIPETPRDWRKLATHLLSEYIQEHIVGEIEVAVGIQGQSRDEGERNAEPSPDWNLKPTWKIQSALAAYYVELLMVMRRFRRCKTCGEDISHQRDKSMYCSVSSTCRSTQWHRENTAKRQSLRADP